MSANEEPRRSRYAYRKCPIDRVEATKIRAEEIGMAEDELRESENAVEELRFRLQVLREDPLPDTASKLVTIHSDEDGWDDAFLEDSIVRCSAELEARALRRIQFPSPLMRLLSEGEVFEHNLGVTTYEREFPNP